MRPLYLKLAAFGPYQGKVELDFTKLDGYDFFLIHGATGAGKTSIFDAICYALYGRTATQDRNGEMLRNQSASLDMPTYVILRFKLNDKIWEVERHPEYTRRAKRGEGTVVEKKYIALKEVTENGDLIKSYDRKEIDAKIRDMIGFSDDQFRQVVLLPQGDFQRFLKSGTNERRELMKVLFNTERYEKLENKLKERSKKLDVACKKIADNINNQLGIYDAENIAAFQNTLNEKKQKLSEQINLAKKLTVELKQVEKEKSAAEILRDKFKELAIADNNFKQAQKQIEADAALRLKLAEAQKVLAMTDIIKQKNLADSELQKRNADLAKLRQAGEKSRKKLDALKKLAEKYAAGKEKRQAERKSLTLMEQLLKEAASLAEKQQQLAKVQTDLAKFKKQIETKDEEISKLKAQKAKNQQEQKVLLRQAASLPAINLQLQQLQAEKEKIEQYQKNNTVANELAKKLAKAKAKAMEQQDAYDKAVTELERKRGLLKTARAAMLAENLQDGEACPVCGSLHHPELAKFIVEKISDAEIKTLAADVMIKQKASTKAQDEVNSLNNKKIKADTALKTLQADLSDNEGKIRSLSEITTILQEHIARQTAADLAAKKQQEIENIIKTNSDAEETLEAEQNNLRMKLSQLETNEAQLKAQCDSIINKLPAEEKDPVKLKQKYDKREKALLNEEKAAEKAKKDCDDFQVQHEAKQTQYMESLKETRRAEKMLAKVMADFTERCASLNITPAIIDEIEQSNWHDQAYCDEQNDILEKHKNEFNTAKATVVKYKNELADKKQPELEMITEKYDKLQNALNNAHSLQGSLQAECEKMTMITKSVIALEAEYQEKSKAYTVVSELSNIASGKSNGRKISFQSYVLNAALNDVLNSANVRLKTMTHGRYYLLLGKGHDNRSDSGLELSIFDNFNTNAENAERAVQTLSGGESFLASLALALGLADTVQQYAGGIRLDTMFIDEGFGTLDQSTLDDALNALFEVQRNGRMVGIISHVEELKKRIPARLEVKKSRVGGSTAQIVIGTADD